MIVVVDGALRLTFRTDAAFLEWLHARRSSRVFQVADISPADDEAVGE